jgi:hypothetical protein
MNIYNNGPLYGDHCYKNTVEMLASHPNTAIKPANGMHFKPMPSVPYIQQLTYFAVAPLASTNFIDVKTYNKFISFQAYMDNFKTKTGKSPEDFKKLAARKGMIEKGEIKEGIKAGEIVVWLKSAFYLRHGHAMALVAFFKGKTV